MYRNKAKHNNALKYTLYVFDIGDKPTFAQLYIQARNIISVSLLQQARNI